MKTKRLSVLIAVFWLVIILGFIASKEFTLRTGTHVLLKTVPVDPRDLFRGDYVTLNYEISTLDLWDIRAPFTNFRIGDKIYVSLKRVHGYGVVSGIHKNSPKSKKLLLKGTAKSAHGKKLTVDYGIESYFEPEGKGKEIERARERKLVVEVSIDMFGNAGIRSLFIDGEQLRFR